MTADKGFWGPVFYTEITSQQSVYMIPSTIKLYHYHLHLSTHTPLCLSLALLPVGLYSHPGTVYPEPVHTGVPHVAMVTVDLKLYKGVEVTLIPFAVHGKVLQGGLRVSVPVLVRPKLDALFILRQQSPDGETLWSRIDVSERRELLGNMFESEPRRAYRGHETDHNVSLRAFEGPALTRVSVGLYEGTRGVGGVAVQWDTQPTQLGLVYLRVW